jgi:hypothetical protein
VTFCGCPLRCGDSARASLGQTDSDPLQIGPENAHGSRNPLGRIVGYASLCSAPGDAFRQEGGTALCGQVAVPMRVPDAGRLPEEYIPSGSDRVRVGLFTLAI